MPLRSVAIALGLAWAGLSWAAPTPSDEYLWWEAESADTTTFKPSADFGTSTFGEKLGLLSGKAWLTNDGPYAGDSLFARYRVTVKKTGAYDLWVRKFWQHGPFVWRFGGQPWGMCGRDMFLLNAVEVRQFLVLDWVRLGRVNLDKGTTSFDVVLQGSRGEALPAGMDCFVLSHGLFEPKGGLKPSAVPADEITVSPRYVVRDSVIRVSVFGADSGDRFACTYASGMDMKLLDLACGPYGGTLDIPVGAQAEVPYLIEVVKKRKPSVRASFDGFIVQRTKEGKPIDIPKELAIWIDVVEHPQRLAMSPAVRPSYPELEKAIRQPENPYKGLKGFHIRAAWSSLWETEIPYTVYVPKGIDLDAPAPALVHLHGSGSTFQSLYDGKVRGHNFDSYPMIVISPSGTLDAGYSDIGLANVQEVLRDALGKYNIDTTRLYLWGESMGGAGAREIARRLPDQFAAVAPSVGTWFGPVDGIELLAMSPTERGMSLRNNGATYLVNHAHVPNIFVTATKDFSLGPSAAAVRLLGSWGSKAQLLVFDAGHDIPARLFDRSEIRKLVQDARRVALDERTHIRFRTNMLRFATSGWVTVDELANWNGVADVDCRYDTSQTPTLECTVRNVSVFTLAPPWPLSKIVVNGTSLPVTHAGPYTIQVKRPKSQMIDGFSAPASRKSARRGGPLVDALYRPFVMVYGTKAGNAELLRAWAGMSAFPGQSAWKGMFGGPEPRFRVVADTAVLADSSVCRGYNLVCFGGPQDNAVVARLPRPQAVAGIDKRGDSTAVATWLRPSPFSDSTYVVVNQARSEAGLHKPADMQFESDWVVYKAGVSRWDGGVVAEGMFGADWLPEKAPEE